ncbi:atrophin-1-like [Dioscorea cayenensis subsp. rotundata]|uniref:Atrophin-1-like n=1 Tax=Dioscorea cayennensis subsp. rotundata TaxID=55577 RepID=A0AB40AUR1_DIOCR|nr:atrophin-1-like [Dioscorea cayenensis subsp. rotundata]
MRRYAWAQATHKWLMDDVPQMAARVQARCSDEKTNTGYLRGCVVALNIWFYEVTGTGKKVRFEAFIRTSHRGEEVASTIRLGAKSREKSTGKRGQSPSPPRSLPRQGRHGSVSVNPPRGVIDEDIGLRLLKSFEKLSEIVGGLQTRVEVIEGRSPSNVAPITDDTKDLPPKQAPSKRSRVKKVGCRRRQPLPIPVSNISDYAPLKPVTRQSTMSAISQADCRPEERPPKIGRKGKVKTNSTPSSPSSSSGPTTPSPHPSLSTPAKQSPHASPSAPAAPTPPTSPSALDPSSPLPPSSATNK